MKNRLPAGVGRLALIAALAAALGSVAQAQPSGEIVFASAQLRQQFDPTAIVAMPDYLAFDPLYDGLQNLSPQGKTPALATSWKISEDGKTIDFTLREGVKFHNGDPFTAEDVKFTYETLTGPNSTHSYRKGFIDTLERVEVVSPLQVRFHLKAPWPSFFSATRYSVQPIIPKNYYEKVGAKGFQAAPVGTGPYKLIEVKAGEWNKFEANTDYWGEKPKVKTIVQRQVKEQFTLYAMLEKGEADIVSGLTGALLERVRANPKLKIVPSRYSGTTGIYFSKSKFPESKDKNVRKAIGMALNREEISSKMLKGICDPASSIFTPATFGYLPDLKPLPYDPAKAKEMLAAAGIKPGYELSIALHTESFGSLPNAPQMLEVLAGNLEAIGFKVTREPYDTAAWLAMMRGGKQPSIFYGPSSSPDDGGELIASWYMKDSVWSSGNVNVPEYSQIFNEQLKSVDLKKREEILQRFAKLESENFESIPAFWCHTTFAVGPRISKWEPPVGTPYNFNLPSIELAK